MYHRTGDIDYRNAALKAAEFSYTELYQKLGKYVGGTPDNPNTVDKEAAIFALYGFNAAYGLSRDKKYLRDSAVDTFWAVPSILSWRSKSSHANSAQTLLLCSSSLAFWLW